LDRGISQLNPARNYSRGGGGGDSGNEAGRDSGSEARRDSGSEAGKDSASRKSAKRRRYVELHQNRLAHQTIDLQVKEASEHWWIRGLCPGLAIGVWLLCPTIDLYSRLTFDCSHNPEENRKEEGSWGQDGGQQADR